MEFVKLGIPVPSKSIVEGCAVAIEPFSLSKEDIVEFAKKYDPLDFHIDEEAASKTRFKGIIASGPHIFTLKHKEIWIPAFGHSVIAGIGIDNWRFLKPVYPEQEIHGHAFVTSTKANSDNSSKNVSWKYEFFDENEGLVQSLGMLVIHKI